MSMTLYALDDIDDAIETTRAFLLPFDRWRWARLALIVFFIGGVGGFNPLQFPGGGGTGGGMETPTGPGGPAAPDTIPSFGSTEVAVIAAFVGLVVLLALGFMFVGSVMEFVFVESLRREAVSIRRYWSERWRQGLRLFGFRLVLSVVTLGLIGGFLVVILSPVIFGGGAFSFGLLLAAIPVFVIVSILSGLITGFTTMFVVPVMLGEERSVLSAWRRFWPTLTGQWKQYVAYAVMGFILQLAGGILAGIALLLGIIVIAIPFGIVGLIGFGVHSVLEGVVGWVIIGIAALLFVLAAIVLVLFISVPVQTFLRYYALLVLGDTNADLDLIPDQRRAARD
jgi:hypothetical protein